MEKTSGIQELMNYIQLGNFDEFKKVMLEHHVDVNAEDESGDTTLHQAAGKGRRDIVRFLIEKGANVNAKNKSGSTPLHKAAVGNQIWCVQFLLEHKADPTIKNNAGILPEQLANFDKVKKLFESGDVVTTELQVPRECHKRIIGQKGAKIQELRIESGAQITVPGPNEKSSAIILKGRPEAVAKAKSMIMRIADQGLKIAEEGAFSGSAVNTDPVAARAAAAAENIVSVSVPVPKERHNLLFQKKNQTALQRFIEEHNVQITVPAATSTDNVIVIRGPQEAVDLAVKRIFAMTSPSPAPAAPSRSSGGGKGAPAAAGGVSSMSEARKQLLRDNRDNSGYGPRGSGRSSNGGDHGGRSADAGSVPSKTTIVVRNISFDATADGLKAAFAGAGEIVNVRLPTFADSGKPRGIAFIEFASEESLSKALELSGTEVDGRKVTVEVANDRAPPRSANQSRAANGTSSSPAPAAKSTPAPAAAPPTAEPSSSDAPAPAAAKSKGGAGGGSGSKPRKTA